MFRLSKSVRALAFCVITTAAVLSNATGVAAESPPAASAPAPSTAAADTTVMTPAQRVQSAPKGTLKNPYSPSDPVKVAEGHELFQSYSCSGCHGGTGGGGMCPPLTNDIWVYGGDDDTLFRLVTLGSDELQKQGYTRTGRENVVGPMPPFGAIIKNADDLWRILAFVRSKYSGDPAYKFGAPPDSD